MLLSHCFVSIQELLFFFISLKLFFLISINLNSGLSREERKWRKPMEDAQLMLQDAAANAAVGCLVPEAEVLEASCFQ